MENNKLETGTGTIADHVPPEREITDAEAKYLAAEELADAQIKADLARAIEAGKLMVDDVTEPGKIRYVVARYTYDETEALVIADRMEQAHLFEEIKTVCFTNGMIDGVTQYKNLIAQKIRKVKKAGKQRAYGEVIGMGESILDYLNKEKTKVSSHFYPQEEAEDKNALPANEEGV